MSTSRIRISVKKFRPLGSVGTTTVEMSLMDSSGNEIAATNGVATDGFLTKTGTYNLRSKRGGTGVPLELKFWVEDRTDPEEKKNKPFDEFEYLIHGITFFNRDQRTSGEKLGQHMFSEVKIAKEKIGGNDVRVLTVTNDGKFVAGKDRESYDYMIFIQRVSDGAFGIIDPEYENEY